jgi:MFS family permease
MFRHVNTDMSLTPTRQRLLLAAVVSGLLLAMLDQTIVGTALPAIVGDLDGWSLYLWVVTAYLVPATVALPVYARLSDRHGRRDLLLIGMASARRCAPPRRTCRS